MHLGYVILVYLQINVLVCICLGSGCLRQKISQKSPIFCKMLTDVFNKRRYIHGISIHVWCLIICPEAMPGKDQICPRVVEILIMKYRDVERKRMDLLCTSSKHM